MKNRKIKTTIVFIVLVLMSVISSFSQELAGFKLVTKFDFDPKINGYGFENYGNEGKWKDDLSAEDLILMFGSDAVCKGGKDKPKCVLNAAARQWLNEQLLDLNNGHCVGMSVSSIKLKLGTPFKDKSFPSDYQPKVKNTFGLVLNQPIENYIAYFQTIPVFDSYEDSPNDALPINNVKELIKNMQAKKDPYVVGIYKNNRGELEEGHAVVPISVYESDKAYKIGIYDNNYPNTTRYLTVDKTKSQSWRYNTSVNKKKDESDYVGNKNTGSFGIDSSDVYDYTCFAAPFAPENAQQSCVDKNAETSPDTSTPKQDTGEEVQVKSNKKVLLTIIDEFGKIVGWSPKQKRFVNEISDAKVRYSVGGTTLPTYVLPYNPNGKGYKIQVSGQEITKETNTDISITGPGFVNTFNDISLDKNERLKLNVSGDGEELSFTASNDGEVPVIAHAVDTQDESYITRVGGIKLEPNTTFTTDLDDENGQLEFDDNDNSDDKFDVDITRINEDGTENSIELNDVDSKNKDNFQIELDDWDGSDKINLKIDDEGNGFDDDENEVEESEDNGIDDDIDDDDIGLANTFKLFDFFAKK
jgi:hypothetical protein